MVETPPAKLCTKRSKIKPLHDFPEIKSISLVVVRGHDLHKLKSFYENLGLSFQAEQHGDGPLHYSARFGKQVFEIYQGQPLRRVSFGLTVDSIELAQQRIVAHGGSLLAGDGFIIVQDPCGNKFILANG